MTKNLTVREQIKKDFGVDLPIIGGSGQSIDDPILIDPEYKDWSTVEYSFIKYANTAQNRNYKVVLTTLLEHNGKQIDQIRIEIEGNSENYYNYYFDVTDHMPKIKK